MTQHPINPPDELLEHWRVVGNLGNWQNALTLAYRAGADQELEACATWVRERKFDGDGEVWSWATSLRAARRPPPPSLKERIAAAITAGDERTALSLLDEALPE